MRFRALATDYDGTLATHGSVNTTTITALQRFAASGRKLLLVTGRELPDLKRVFPQYALFDRVVAENGALLYRPASDTESLLCDPVSPGFVTALRDHQIRASVGRGIVATTEEHFTQVQRIAVLAGLQLEMKLNKGSLMVLPLGVTKASGLAHALQELAISPEHVVGIGDAENDTDLLRACGFAVAVANALPAIKSQAQLVTLGTHGDGVVEVIDELLATDSLACARGGRGVNAN